MEGIKLEKNPKAEFSQGPYDPEMTRAMSEYSTLSSMKEALTNENVDLLIIKEVNTIIEHWRNEPFEVEPFSEMQSLLDRIRQVPRGTERIILMNSIVRTLGQPDTLATFLDMLRDSATREGTKEQYLCKNKLQNVRMHSIYGWCGNTLIIESSDESTEGTSKHIPGLGEKLGNSPSAWNMTIHVWQPNLSAEGFPVNAYLEKNSIQEPPHSHPFDFVSTIVKGSMHQSLYTQDNDITPIFDRTSNRYSETNLEHVDGVWPPHDFRETKTLKMLEDRIFFEEGDSYYMPCDWIHDVEIDGSTANTRPTISLFLSSEYMVMPHVYMTQSMADFHSKNPDMKLNGVPIPESAWHEKLKAISKYLRDESSTLNMNEIIKYEGKYAFFHINP